MKQEDYVTFEVAKLLKEKGYIEPCLCIYDNGGKFYRNEYNSYNDDPNIDYLCSPTLYDAQKWLREKRNLHISVGMYGDCSYDADGNVCEEWYAWSFTIYYTTNLEHPMIDFEATCDTYEEALNEGIKEALKYI